MQLTKIASSNKCWTWPVGRQSLPPEKNAAVSWTGDPEGPLWVQSHWEGANFASP